MTQPIAIFLSALLLLGACVATNTAPVDNRPFAPVGSLQEITGIYQNRGEGDERYRPLYLSALLWPGDETLHHGDIETIVVSETAAGVLEVSARTAQMTVKSGRYVEGKDFKLEDGRLLLGTQTGMAGLKAGEPLLGAYRQEIELGLDTTGQGKARQHVSAAGLAFLLIPIAADSTEEVRFLRLSAETE
ncbi:hypothetical protein [Desulfuromonas sp. AOP6]|uniref:hypothetical protein n=1 Tax=Desulfuromonas sp. AOP6 TaxID=1566351 RepID=UPI001279F1E2|nr:hypothetical protein [Desulfuromonas sp. AOP6]BCA78536.1 hypothetical protein AOP6_0323 [Desulfuromonas sp. AOP6]